MYITPDYLSISIQPSHKGNFAKSLKPQRIRFPKQENLRSLKQKRDTALKYEKKRILMQDMVKTLKEAFDTIIEQKMTKFSIQKFSEKNLDNYIKDWNSYYRSGYTKNYKIGNLLTERLNMTDEEYENIAEIMKGKKIYKAIIERCHNDIDNAILSKKPPETISNLFDTLNIFIEKFGYYNK